MKELKEELDQIAKNYHLSSSMPDMHIEEIGQYYCTDWLMKHIPSGGSVLEMGYGDGVVTQRLINAGTQLTVLEGSSLLYEQANQKHRGQAKFVEGFFEEYEANAKFDVVIASHVLEHVDTPDSLLKRMSSWLKPGGVLIAIVPNQNSIHRQLAVIMGLQPQLDTLSPRDHIVGHKRVYSMAQLESDITRANFHVIEKKGFFLKTLPNSMMLEYKPELLHALNKISERLPAEVMCNIGLAAVKK